MLENILGHIKKYVGNMLEEYVGTYEVEEIYGKYGWWEDM